MRIVAYQIVITGYSMARNLRSKMPSSNTLMIFDINNDVMGQFVKEAREDARGSGTADDARQVTVATSARYLAEKAVRTSRLGLLRRLCNPTLDR